MGVYYTCRVCGKTEKGMWPCDCPQKETAKNIQLKVGCKILEAYQEFEETGFYLYEKLETPDGDIIWMRTCLSGGDGEHEDQWKVVLLQQSPPESEDESEDELEDFGHHTYFSKDGKVVPESEREDEDEMDIRIPDPVEKNKPKRAISAYLFFASDRRPELKKEEPDLGFGALTHKIAEEWKEMSQKDKKPFLDRAKVEKERYEREKEIFEHQKAEESRYVDPETLEGEDREIYETFRSQGFDIKIVKDGVPGSLTITDKTGGDLIDRVRAALYTTKEEKKE